MAIRRTIIYVDDIHFSLVTLKDRLKESYEVFLAQSAEQMYEVLENFLEKRQAFPDLILLDLNMPERDGFQVLNELKEENLYNDIPVIIISSRNDRNSMMRAIEYGAGDFLSKPVSDEKLIDSIEYQLEPKKNYANRPVVLAVDDNPSILQAVKHIIGDKYTVYLLQESNKLKEVIDKITPDLFLLDCNMPGLSGFELVPIIKDNERYKETPIMYLTSDGTIDNLSAAVASGASGFIVKPIDEKILLEKVAAQLDGFLIRRRIGEQEADNYYR